MKCGLSSMLVPISFIWFWKCFKITVALTSNAILDLSVFGDCVIHFTRMKDDQETVDQTEAIIHAQYENKHSHQHQLFSVFNSSFNENDPVSSLIQPTIAVKEECTLNVLLGFKPDQRRVLRKIVRESHYTYSADPFSTYIIVLDSLDKYVNYHSWRKLPTRIFYFVFPKVSILAHNDQPHLCYLCHHCGEYDLIKLHITSELALISYINFQPILVQLEIVFRTGQASSRMNLALEKTSVDPCTHEFIKILSKTTKSNMTIIVEPLYSKETFYSGYTGNIQIGIFYDVITFRQTTSCWYDEQFSGQILYCTCKSKTQRTFIYEGWIGSFQPNLWLGVLITILSVSFVVACKSPKISTVENKSPIISGRTFFASVFQVFTLFLRQGQPKKHLLILLVNFIAQIVLASYENYMTSAIIIPSDSPVHHTLNSLIDADYTLLFETNGLKTFQNQVPELKYMKAFDRKQIQQVNSSTFDSLRLKAMDTSGNYLSFLDWVSDKSGKHWLDQLQSANKGCKCFILKDGFTEIRSFISINHFLRPRFQRTLNRLRDYGLYKFCNTNCYEFHHKWAEIRIRRNRRAEEFTSNSQVSQSSSESTDYIGSSSLNVIYCSLGILCLSWILFFIVLELKLHIVIFRLVSQVLSRRNLIKLYFNVRLDIYALVRRFNRLL
jgi:hypothetical protein